MSHIYTLSDVANVLLCLFGKMIGGVNVSLSLLLGSGGKDVEEDGEDCQDDDADADVDADADADVDADADADEDDSDLDMAWKMLDIARAITDKHSTETMEKVDILCALAEISLERGRCCFLVSTFVMSHFVIFSYDDFELCYLLRRGH